jgi:prepilin signal peptidase PulO-like enzyme (type II secretory pathway)
MLPLGMSVLISTFLLIDLRHPYVPLEFQKPISVLSLLIAFSVVVAFSEPNWRYKSDRAAILIILGELVLALLWWRLWIE